MHLKIVCVMGSGFSGIGKGVITASVAKSCKMRGQRVFPIKFDGYLNQNSGTMNPYHLIPEVIDEEEEVFVLKDGWEVDSDLGTYERFLDMELTKENNPSGGDFIRKIVEIEQKHLFPIGKTLYFPHLVQIAKDWLYKASKKADVILLEIGGVITDRETDFMIEALRQLEQDNKNSIYFILLAGVPLFDGSRRTKPSRQAFRQLMSKGINADTLVLRSEDQILRSDLKTTEFFAD